MLKWIDLSARGKARVYLLTILGTSFCIIAAYAIDSYSFETGEWTWIGRADNNLFIPLIVAPPFFLFLLSKLRELAIAHHELIRVASTDTLTNCLNRRAFTEIVEGYLDRMERREDNADGALMVLDIDNFKAVNDEFGHDIGDEALKLVAQAISASVRDGDIVARIGGEEFGVFLTGLDPPGTAIIAERIRSAVQATDFAPDGSRHGLSLSIGAAAFNHRVTFTELYRKADQLLYSAKRGGRNRVELASFGGGAPTASFSS